MRPRHAVTGVVTSVGGAALAWCAVLLVRADLTAGSRLAALALWLLGALAVGTLAAFVREVERHRRTSSRSGGREATGARRERVAGRPGTATPLPSLVLLWVGGLTALVVYPFMLSGSGGSGHSAPQREAGSTAVTTPAVTATTPAAPRTSPTSVSRSATRHAPAGARRTVTPLQTTATPRRSTSDPSATPSSTATPPGTTSTSSTPTPSATTTTNPGGITVTLLPKPTKPKG